MSERDENEIGQSAPKAKWTRPGVDRLVAGAAEGAADITSDGPSLPS